MQVMTNSSRIKFIAIPMTNSILLQALDFLDVGMRSRSPESLGAQVTEQKWFPPQHGWFKLNFACRCSTASNLVGVGILIRDSKGVGGSGLGIQDGRLWGRVTDSGSGCFFSN